MDQEDVFDRLEQGAIDVAQAMELLRSPGASAGPGAGEQGGPASSGRVQLRALGARRRSPESPPDVVRVRLSPLDRGAQPESPAVRSRGDSTGDVVRLSRAEPGIAVVAIEDEEGQNRIGPRFAAGLERAATEIRRDDSVRVVVVHGVGTWFSTGGTPEALAALRSGQARFTDFSGFRLLLDLEVPTIAAMQGHAFGGGFAFGLYADLIVLAEESYYAGNFLQHGFTPGMGATYLFPYKLGSVLGTEMLFTARRYTGRELANRGAALMVEPRGRVVERALELARGLAGSSVELLRLLKRRLTAEVRRSLPEAIEEELAMHRELFGASDP